MLTQIFSVDNFYSSTLFIRNGRSKLIKNEFIYSYILFSIHILKIFTAASKNKVFSF